jgi:hypothetical protein
MHCENCGHKLETSDKFCTKCGTAAPGVVAAPSISDESWWYRLLKVIYILLYILLPFLLWLVWDENATSWNYGGGYQDTTGSAIWYTFITLVVYIVIVRLIKLACLYIAAGEKLSWKKEFKRLF